MSALQPNGANYNFATTKSIKPFVETLMDKLHKLIEKKKYWGFLSGRDALDVLTACPGKWTQRDFEQLTRWQLGFPTTVQFQN
jgi:hypothetical protein